MCSGVFRKHLRTGLDATVGRNHPLKEFGEHSAYLLEHTVNSDVNFLRVLDPLEPSHWSVNGKTDSTQLAAKNTLVGLQIRRSENAGQTTDISST